jgi:hypothetical protein
VGGLDETTVALIVVGIVGPIVGGIVGWLLGRHSTEALHRVDREQERKETAQILLPELASIKNGFESRAPDYIGSTPYWQDFPYLPTGGYTELRSAGRIAKLGPELASQLNAAYGQVTMANEVYGAINAVPRRYELSTVQQLFEAKWVVLRNCKLAFLAAYPSLEGDLRKIASASVP